MTHRKLPVIENVRASAATSRRQFMWLASVAAAAFAAHGCDGDDTTGAGGNGGTGGTGGTGGAPPVGGEIPTLGGAPDTAQGWTVAAFVDTVIPGKHRDPTGAPGGIDVGVPGMFFDPALPALQFVGILQIVLDAQADVFRSGADFIDLTYDERDAVLETLLADESPMDLAVQLTKVGFYSNPEIATSMGYPGPNAGYITDPDYSFGIALAGEVTTDGNMP